MIEAAPENIKTPPTESTLLKQILDNQTKILERLTTLEKKVIELGRGCKRAFEQTKEVVNRLGDFQQHLGESLDEYGGVIEASTYDWG